MGIQYCSYQSSKVLGELHVHLPAPSGKYPPGELYFLRINLVTGEGSGNEIALQAIKARRPLNAGSVNTREHTCPPSIPLHIHRDAKLPLILYNETLNNSLGSYINFQILPNLGSQYVS